MGLSRLEIQNFRNLHSVRADLSPGFNGLCGPNGSGKTSFLEALYILGRGTSFRTKDLGRALLHGAEQFFIAGKLESPNIPIGIEYQANGLEFRIGGQVVRSRVELASHLPLLFISPDSHALISEGPQQRRRFLDWGVFHVEPGFLPAWRRYQRSLKQRNKALGTPGVETAWDIELARAAEEITQLRSAYLARLEPYIDQFIEWLIDLDKLNLSFACGWRQEVSFLEALRSSLPQDREYGFTRLGPHRADIIFKVGNRPARDTVSRGQQKLLVIALLLAQVALLNEVTTLRPVILVDDLAAELDIHHRQRLLTVLAELKAQVILTVTERQVLPASGELPIQWFHVEQGNITPN
jgi:DNA replication and repair protein RecF